MRKLVVLSALVLGCGPSPVDDGNGNGNGVDGGGNNNPFADARTGGPNEFADAAPVEACNKMDILFVVDNSGSMTQEQANLATNFPGFISVLDAAELDYRVGITTTGMDYDYAIDIGFGPIPSSQSGGDNGELLQRCNMQRRWVEAADPTASTDFACAAEVGANGPASEMPLAAMRAAFDERIADGTNTGFLREDALLAVVILTDENDCSYEQSVTFPFGAGLCDSMMEPVGNYVSFMDDLTGDRARWATAVIAGPGPGDCSSSFGDADESTRLIDFVGQTGTNAVMSSICEGDLTVGLQDALDTFELACDNFPPIP
jgi:hypothetical protein